jgi:hypothetical protein
LWPIECVETDECEDSSKYGEDAFTKTVLPDDIEKRENE